MTDTEFETAKGIVFDNIVRLTNPLGRPPAYDEFLAAAAKAKQILKIYGKDVSAADFDKILRAVRAGLTVQMEDDEAVIDDDAAHKKWLAAVKSDIDWFFWTRYENYLRHDKNWSPTLTAALNVASDKILDLTGNPRSTENFSRRGLIIGEVQSGKTANYTALCAKAADAGYKIIIVLTGMLEDLRRQTQARLDLEFAGRESQIFLSKASAAIKNRAVGAGKYGQAKSIAQFTSVNADFRSATLDNLSLGLRNLNGTVLFVVKKNKRILENLIAWLKNSIDLGKDKINHSLLLLDDEADNASVNTRDADEDPTAINDCIRTILKLFNQTTYIGVTATPFANIFINPFDEQGMLNDDLFPRDFIYALDVPTNYIGAEKIFGGEYKNFLVPLEPASCPDAEVYFPKNHRITLKVKRLPESLCAAVDYFLLANAVRDLRGEPKSHRTMLIHVSRFKSVHAQLYDLVNTRLNEIVNALRAYACLPAAEAERESPYIKHLRGVFDKYGLEKLGGVSWAVMLRDYLRKAAEPVQVGLRNSDAKNSFSYEQNPDGLRVIAIGGNSFSRGLTLEGLCVTYFYRNSKTYDTLMQMGRWFGYRPNYDDLCRLWTSQEIIDWYGYIAGVARELKDEIAFMSDSGRTPKEFGLKVRRHPDTLEITARNKMRYGTAVKRPVALNKVFIETPRLANDAEILSANENLIRNFIDGLDNFTKLDGKNLWRGIPKNLVANLVLNFKGSAWQQNFQGQPLGEYIMTKSDAKPWDVLIPEGAGDSYGGLTVGGKSIVIKPVVRTFLVDENQMTLSGTKLRLVGREIAQVGLTAEQVAAIEKNFYADKKNHGKELPAVAYLIHERNPLLILYAVQPKFESPSARVPKVLFGLGLGFPAVNPSVNESQIKTADFVINAVGNEEGIEE